jgi:hypothetical protein
MTNGIRSIDLEISTSAKCFLREFGWSEDRNVNLDVFSSEITKRGFKLNSVAEQILRQLGGITYRINTGGIAWFRFDHQECFHTFRNDHVSVLEALIGETDPCPIGGGAGYILFAFPRATFALLHEQWFFLSVSDSFASIVDAMIFKDLTGCRVITDVEDYRPDW